MKKKLLTVLMTAMVIVLAACGASKKAEKAPVESNPEDFIALTESYFEKQQALMMKQAEGMSGEFAEVSQHAKEVIESDEYKAWQKEVDKVENFKIKKTKETEPMIELQGALNDYGKIQSEYFEELAKAKDEDGYNEVNTKLAERLNETQEKFIKIMEKIEE